MGTDVYLCYGVVIKADPQRKLVPVVFNACSNAECPKADTDVTSKFCADCGSPTVKKHAEEYQTRDIRDFLEQYTGGEFPDIHGLHYDIDDDKDNVWTTGRNKSFNIMYDGVAKVMIDQELLDSQRELVEEYKTRNAGGLQALREYGVDFEVVSAFWNRVSY